MPVYNTPSGCLAAAIQSVLDQRYGNWELFIIDDGSGNYVQDIVRNFNDARINFHRFERNCGMVEARNYGLEHASGEYIAFLDSDDIALPERLGKEAAYLDAHPETGCVFSNVEIIGQDKEHADARFFEGDVPELENYLLFKGNCICFSSVMVKNSVLKENRIKFSSKYNIAVDYGFLISLVGKTGIHKLGETLAKYRYDFSNITHTKKHMQKAVSIRTQLDALNSMLGLSITYFDWAKLQAVNPSSYSFDDLKKILGTLDTIISALRQRGMFSKYVVEIFKKKVKMIFYHSHGVSKQLLLLRYPFDKDLNLGIWKKLYCFATRIC